MINLIIAIKEVCEKQRILIAERDRLIDSINKKYNKQIDDLQCAIRELKRVNNACLDCEGKGNIKHDHAEGMVESVTCEKCHGTGLKYVPTGGKDADDYDM